MRPTKHLFRYLIIAMLGVLVLNTSTLPDAIHAQDDPEAEINRLAAAVHIQDSRWGTATSWIGGNLGARGSGSNPAVGQMMTNWTLTDMYDQDVTFDITNLERPVVMNLWASWCGPCQFEFPLLTEYAERDDLNFDLWFVNTGDTSLAAGQRFLRDQSDQLITMYDTNDRFAANLGLRAYPTTILVDTDGTIIASRAGIVTYTVMDFFNAVAAAPRTGGIDTSAIEFDLLAFLQPIDADSATPLTVNQQSAGILSNDDWRNDYRFEGTANETITINVTYVSDEVEAYIAVIGPDNQLVEPNLNNSRSDVSGISLSLTLPEDGTYVVVVSRFLEDDGFGEGGYNIIINTDGADSNQSGNALVLESGVSSTGILTYERKQQAYTLDVTAGQVVTFSLTHDMPEEELSLQARLGGARLVSYTKTIDGALEVVATVEESGTYSVYVARSNTSRVGPITYTLLVTIEGDAASPPADEGDTTDTSSVPTDGGQNRLIAYGDVVTDSIDDATFEHRYDFVGTTGDVVTVQMILVEGDLDASLQLLGTDGEVIAENDDADFTTTNAAIADFELTADGTYTIVATRYQGERGLSTGTFELSLSAAEIVIVDPTPPTTDVTMVAYGDTVSGTIDNDIVRREYQFTGEQGDVVTINLEGSGGLDTYLFLLTSDGTSIAENDDVEVTTTNAGLRNFVLPEDGTYTIVATRFLQEDGLSVGEFTLSLTLADVVDIPDTPTTPDGLILLTYGDSVDGTITDDAIEQSYGFEGNAGDVVSITVAADENGSLDTALTVLGPEGDVVSENDDIDFLTTDSAIENFELPTSGTYTIVVSRFNGETGRSEGDFTLTLTLAEEAGPTINVTDNEPIVITIDSDVISEITDRIFEREFTFEGVAGDIVTIDVRANDPLDNLDANLTLLSPSGEVLFVNDDRDLFNGDLNPVITDFELPVDGTYTIVVGRYLAEQGTSTGAFTLVLTRGSAEGLADTTLSYGDTVTGRLDNQTYQINYRFEGQQGDVVTVIIFATSGNLDTTLLMSDPNGEFLAFNDDYNNLDSALIDVVLPQDGLYTISASRYLGLNGDSSGDFEMSLSVVEPMINVPDTDDTPPSGGDTAEFLEFSDAIDDNAFAYTYSFDADAGDVVTISMEATSGTLDPLLILEGPNGTEVARNDDQSLTSNNALMPDLTLSQTGTYTITATRYQGENGISAGEFALTVTIIRSNPVVDAGPTPATVPTVENGVAADIIGFGDVVRGTIDADNLEDRYVFEGRAGQVVTVIMSATSGSLDPYLSLLNEQGIEVAFNDDDIKSVGNDAVIVGFKLPANGTYTIVAARYGAFYGVTSGDYDLSLSQ